MSSSANINSEPELELPEELVNTLCSTAFLDQASVWAAERDYNVDVLKHKFLETPEQSALLDTWWHNSSPEVRLAIVFTAKEDISSRGAEEPSAGVSFLLAQLVDLLCPEISDELTVDDQFLSLLRLSAANDTVNTESMSVAALEELFKPAFAKKGDSRKTDSVVLPLMLARSCLLSQFFVNAALILKEVAQGSSSGAEGTV